MQSIREFLGSIPPFDLLSEDELDMVVAHTDIAYFAEEERIDPKNFFVIFKGYIAEKIDEETLQILGPKDYFDVNALAGKSRSTFVAQQESLLYEIEKEIVKELLQKNSDFKNYLIEGISHKIDKLQQFHSLTNSSELLSARVGDLILPKPIIIKGSTPIKEAVTKLESILIVEQNSLYGVLTLADLKKVITLNIPYTEPVSAIASFPAQTIDSQDFLFNALLKITALQIKHLVVTEDSDIVGTLEIGEILSFLSNQTYFLAKRIQKASCIEELKELYGQFNQMASILYHKGVKTRYIAKLINELNKMIYAKVASHHFTTAGEVLLLGSEGRGEQIVRSDQDNAYLCFEDRQSALKEAQNFIQDLLTIGFPKCPGEVMASNELWCDTPQGFKTKIENWIERMDEESLLYLSIFLDASSIAHNSQLPKLKAWLFERAGQNRALFSHMAKKALQFETPITFFNIFKTDHHKIDLKKGGLFPIVHGVRTLALEQGIEQTNTVERIKQLAQIGIFDKEFATELIESFEIFQRFRLQNALEQVENQNILDITRLSKIEKDILKDSFSIVDRFKKLLIYHFRLDMVS